MSTTSLAVRRCRDCGHRVAAHLAAASPAEDYHRQYPAGRFLSALERTRRRQARELLRRLAAELGEVDGLLDLGAGRGWLLDEARRVGVVRCAGADTSAAAVEALGAAGLEAVRLEPVPETWASTLCSLSFRPRIVALLDVAEHFPVDDLVPWLEAIVDALRPHLRLLALKLPLAEGLLFRGARTLAWAGSAGPYEQLFQVGTEPPHYHLFTRRSVRGLIERLGLEPLEPYFDAEFEPASLSDRVHALRGLPRPVGTAVGAGLSAAVHALGWYDAEIALARCSPETDEV